MSQSLGMPAWMALLSSPDLMGKTSPASAPMPAAGTSDRFEALVREVFAGGGPPGMSLPLAVPEATEAPKADVELDPMSPEAWEIPGNVVPLAAPLPTQGGAPSLFSAAPAGASTASASDALPFPPPGHDPASRPSSPSMGSSEAPVAGTASGPPRSAIPPTHALALESLGFDPGAAQPMAMGEGADIAPEPRAERPSLAASSSQLGPRAVPLATAGPAGAVDVARPAPVPLGAGVPLRAAGVAPFPAAPVASTFPGPTPTKAQGASRRGPSLPARPDGSAGSHSAPLPFAGADAGTGAASMAAPSPMETSVRGQVDPEVVMNVDEQAAMRPSDGPVHEDGPGASEAPVESQGFRIVSHAGPGGHYGSHRSAHHTSPASIPPPSQSFDAAPEPESPVLDLSALHRDAVAALSEEGAEVRVRVDDDVAVDVRVEGETVHVVLETTEAVAREFDGMQQELADQLAQSGAELGSYARRSREDESEADRSPSHRAGGEGETAEVESSNRAPVARGRLVNRIA